jgi:hypothetical protein
MLNNGKKINIIYIGSGKIIVKLAIKKLQNSKIAIVDAFDKGLPVAAVY